MAQVFMRGQAENAAMQDGWVCHRCYMGQEYRKSDDTIGYRYWKPSEEKWEQFLPKIGDDVTNLSTRIKCNKCQEWRITDYAKPEIHRRVCLMRSPTERERVHHFYNETNCRKCKGWRGSSNDDQSWRNIPNRCLWSIVDRPSKEMLTQIYVERVKARIVNKLRGDTTCDSFSKSIADVVVEGLRAMHNELAEEADSGSVASKSSVKSSLIMDGGLTKEQADYTEQQMSQPSAKRIATTAAEYLFLT